ncbi:tyrosine-type recombinase/integrase [Prescottella equi]
MSKKRGGVALATPKLWADAVDNFKVHLTAAGRSAETIRTRLSHICTLARAHARIAPTRITAEQVVRWAGRQEWTPATRRSFRHSAGQFFGWLVATGRAAADASAGLPAVPQTRPRPRPVPERLFADALSVVDRRGALVLRLMGELGLRRGEVARVHTDDLLEDTHGWSLVVHGKGGRQRVLPLTDELAAVIAAGAAGHTPGMSRRGWLFPGQIGGHLSPGWVGKLASRALPGVWTGHKLRHRFATVAYSVDRDLLTVQQLLGHASPETTQRYVVPPDDVARRTAAAAGAPRLRVA